MALDLKALFPNTNFPTAEELKAKEDSFSIGDRVKVADNIRCRQKGKTGTIARIEPEDKHGWKSFIVKFDDEKYGAMGFQSGDIDKINERGTTMKKINENADDYCGSPYNGYEKKANYVIPYLKHNDIHCRKFGWLGMAGDIDIVKIDGKIRKFNIKTKEEVFDRGLHENQIDMTLTKRGIEDAIPADAKDGLIEVCEPDGSFGSRSWYVKYASGSGPELETAEAGIKKAFPEVRTRRASFPGGFNGGDFIIITPPYTLNEGLPRNEFENKGVKISENTKVTLTIGQLRRLVKESVKRA